eukprot:PITA_13802
MSKCEVRLTKILYLGHVIGEDRVKVHWEKIKAILDWPTPKNVTETRGFLGICTYYRGFIRGFPQLATPLTNLTKKGATEWTKVTQEAFKRLKKVMSNCPVLALPNFTRPLYWSMMLPLYSVYDKEMLVVMHALAKFRQYLVGNRFKVKTDHNSLQFFLKQQWLEERQQKGEQDQGL